MTLSFKELIKKVRSLKAEEVRKESPSSLEIVFDAAFQQELEVLLKDFFGPAAKHAGEPSDKETQKLCGPHGGIQSNQILYEKKGEYPPQFAMIWPWQSESKITVKIIAAF